MPSAALEQRACCCSLATPPAVPPQPPLLLAAPLQTAGRRLWIHRCCTALLATWTCKGTELEACVRVRARARVHEHVRE